MPIEVTRYQLTLPTYPQPQAEDLPMFAKNRVHQRSSGNPYPNKVVLSTVRDRKEDVAYECIRLENEYLRVEILPALGGRIYSALDKTTGYDFFYKQHVIKPALIGLLGSWISGGCEFNWPCHHRPSTYMPVDTAIEREEGGAITVWLSEHEPFHRMKGMVGIRLAPGAAVFQTRMRVYNRTPIRHSFLWWENAAVPVNESYRLFFPPDVHHVQFHYRKNVTTYPVAQGTYNGIRMGEGVDIRLHKNTRHPTSYFSAASRYDFFGGYDEEKRCGVVHVANRHTAIGKKMFTWAYGQLGRSWERALTDTDGPYAELMAGSYSDNQPDFTWLEPYESKAFEQSWYPLGDIGAPCCGTEHAALAIEDGALRLQATRVLRDANLCVDGCEMRISLTPGQPLTLPVEGMPQRVTLRGAGGEVLLCYEAVAEETVHPMPHTLPDNPTLDALPTAQACYLAGVHVAQYRDPAIQPDAYFREALRRDPQHGPSLIALARYELENHRVQEARTYALNGWQALTVRNNHPESGEPAYLLGLICEALGRDAEAEDWHQRAAYQQDARSRAMTRLAMLAGHRKCAGEMLRCADEAILGHAGNLTARALSAVACRLLGRAEEAEVRLAAILTDDPLFHLARLLREGPVHFENALQSDARQTCLDLVEDLVSMGDGALARSLLSNLTKPVAMTAYVHAWLDQGKVENAVPLEVGIAYPSRYMELVALEAALAAHPNDATACDLLACQLYATGNTTRAVELWTRAMDHAADVYRPYRNLAVALYGEGKQPAEVLARLAAARLRAPGNAQLVWETAYVMGRMRKDPQEVLTFLEGESCAREDILLEKMRQMNLSGRYEETLSFLAAHTFTPCEGGEHAVAEPYMLAHHALGRQALAAIDMQAALAHFRAAQSLPENLGSGLWHEVMLVPHQFHEALCLQALGEHDAARDIFAHIVSLDVDGFSDMHLPELPCWQAMALRKLNRAAKAQAMIANHVSRYTAARTLRDAGFFKTTPFFISYMEPAPQLRAAFCDWQLAMAHRAAGELDRARALAKQAIHGEPFHAYAQLFSREGRHDLP